MSDGCGGGSFIDLHIHLYPFSAFASVTQLMHASYAMLGQHAAVWPTHYELSISLTCMHEKDSVTVKVSFMHV